MSIYAIDKLIEETRRVASEFHRSTGTILPVSAEISRYDVSRLLGFELMDDRNLGYDAITGQDLGSARVLVKSRVIKDCVNSNQRIGQMNFDADWEMVALSVMDQDFAPLEIYLISRDALVDELENCNSRRNRRGAMSLAKFMIIADLVWTAEEGRIDDSSVDKAAVG